MKLQVLFPMDYSCLLYTSHEVIGKYIHKVMFDELMETLNLPKDELEKFDTDVLERFNNPRCV